MYLALFAHQGTTELAEDFLLEVACETEVQQLAQTYAEQWGIELFSVKPATVEEIALYQRLGKTVTDNQLKAALNCSKDAP